MPLDKKEMWERLNKKTFKLFAFSQIVSAIIWILILKFNSLDDNEKCPTISTYKSQYKSAQHQLEAETEGVKTLVQVMYKITSDLGRAHGQKSYGRMKHNLNVILNDLSSALDNYSNEVSTLAKTISQDSSDNAMLFGSSPKHICPEVYDNRIKDYPLFRYGWKTQNCSKSIPINLLLTFAINFIGKSQHFILTRGNVLLRNIGFKFPGMTVMVAIETNLPRKYELIDLNFIPIILKAKDSSEILPRFAEFCKTPYILIGANLTYFDGRDENVERLIRQISYTGIDIAGGSLRDKDGRWSMACEQLSIEKFSLKYTPGYEMSQSSCVLCNSIDGPFVARTDWLKSFQFDIELDETSQISDIFISRTLEMKPSFVCPDVMFYVDNNLQQAMHSRSLVLPLAKKHEITNVYLADGKMHKFGSSEILDGCQNSRRQTLIRPRCCLENLQKAVKHVLKICAKLKMLCELSEGTLFGALKFNGLLPWEKDADIIVRLGNVTLPEFGRALSTKEYRIQCKRGREPICLLHTKYWIVEARAIQFLDSQELQENHLARTKVKFGDIWAPAARNPGSNIRNRYGREIYRHADHWTVLGYKHSWQPYESGKWIKCKFPGHRSCLDRYRADGNLDFIDYTSEKKNKKPKSKAKKKIGETNANEDNEDNEDDEEDDRRVEKRKGKRKKIKKRKSKVRH